eukprot:TRINITY_DN8787_c0_g1_i1.p1 TRINITY_DN8787_c0_g1~~TRINITY_DN8787_c0_g1_i1.p1  ORF type:complete len:276 (+),score=76.79 TRINITY_DN8787_c0_g1_i1:147-974(+)
MADYNTGTRRISEAAAAHPAPPRSGGRVRGVSFKQEYSRAAGVQKKVGRARAPSMVSEPLKCMLPPQSVEDRGRITVVLDLDETLIYAREGPLYARPGLNELLEFLSTNCEPVVWTAGVKAYAQAVIRNIDQNQAFRHCVYRHKKWFSGCAGYNKDLTLLGRDMSKLIILENTPDCVRGNEENGILVADYEGGELPDSTIPRMTEFLAGLIDSGLSVPRYLAQCPMLTRRNVPTDRGDYIECYWLDTSASHSTAGTRINRDLSAEQRLGAPRYGR